MSLPILCTYNKKLQFVFNNVGNEVYEQVSGKPCLAISSTFSVF